MGSMNLLSDNVRLDVSVVTLIELFFISMFWALLNIDSVSRILGLLEYYEEGERSKSRVEHCQRHQHSIHRPFPQIPRCVMPVKNACVELSFVLLPLKT